MDARLHSMFRPIQANGRVAAYKYVEIMPAPALRSFVACYWASEPIHPAELSAPASSEAVDRVLPDGCTDMIFEQDLWDSRYRVSYCGMLDYPFSILYDEKRPVRRFGVRFFPGGAYPFIKTSLCEFANRLLALDAVWPHVAEEIGERIAQAATLDEKVRLIEHYLVAARKINKEVECSQMANVLYRIFRSKGTLTIRELAEAEAISVRQLNRHFARYIGTNPKTFCAIVRFQAVISDIVKGRETDWRYIALNRGFFDQAHLIHEFNRFYGASPTVAVSEYQKMSDFYNPFSV